MYNVIVEYGPRRKPRLFGPFFSHIEAQLWLDAWVFPEIAKSKGYFVPHTNPNHFNRATIVEVKPYLETPKYSFKEVSFYEGDRIEFRNSHNHTFLTVWKQKDGSYKAKRGASLSLMQWREYAELRINDVY